MHGEKLSLMPLSLPRIPTRKTWEGTRTSVVNILQLTFRAIVRLGMIHIALQAGRLQVRFPIGSLGGFTDLILPDALWPWNRLGL